MYGTVDIYLGTLLIMCGFALSMFNLQRLVKRTKFSAVLISENVFLVCIGVAFISRSLIHINPKSMNSAEFTERHGDVEEPSVLELDCNFQSVLFGYGPLVVSVVNSFLSLIIDNYIHYSIIKENKERHEENTVRNLSNETRILKESFWNGLYNFIKKHFSFIAIGIQWIIPLLLALLMYPMGVKETMVPMNGLRNLDETCMTIMQLKLDNCSQPQIGHNNTLDLRGNVHSAIKYIQVEGNEASTNTSNEEITAVIDKIQTLVANYKNDTKVNYTNLTLPSPFRTSKLNVKCMSVCYSENRNIVTYMFLLAVVSYFTPITISTIILTKIHNMKLKKTVVKDYVSREMLYNILFWTPVMFDTFLSLLLCSYESNGTRTSIFNVIANVYQVVKNFMNTKYFSNNAILPE